jgi:hypothetical protein
MVESVFVVAAVAGLVEFCKRVWAKDWEAATIILGAAIIGVVAGWFAIDGLTVMGGFIAGLAASGTYQVASTVAK